MKKLSTLLLLIGLSVVNYGQTFLQEDFSSNTMPPPGWSLENYAFRWTVEMSNHAGGTEPEARFALWPEVDTTRLISPTVDLSGLDTVRLSFKHYVNDYDGYGYQVGVATRSGEGNWSTVWNIFPSGNVGPEEINVTIDNDDVGADDFQICFYVAGDLYNLDYWFLDDIWLFQSLDLDVGIQVINTPTYITEPALVEGTIKSFGMNEVDSVEISWQLGDEEKTFTLFDSLNLQFGDEFNFICNGLINQPPGTYTLSVKIESVNGVLDDNLSNNLLTKIINVASHVVPHKPALEEFTSSTCGPCAGFNATFDPWCDLHQDDITLVKYQMNWPGYGDPYYTAEGGVRRDWYNVNAVPSAFLDGENTNSSLTTINNMFNASLAEPGLVKVIGSNSLSGTDMDINVSVLPFVSIENAIIHIVVFEYITYNNATTNGETEFHHVMMKMVPDAYGTVTSLQDRIPLNISDIVDLSGTHVEEWDDLGVAIIVQDTVSKYIYQSGYTIENANFNMDATLSDLMVDGVTIPDFSPDVYYYMVELPNGSQEIPEVEATPNDPNATTVIVPTKELPGATTVDVFAEDLVTFNTYTVFFDNTVGYENIKAKTITVYPNPTDGYLYVKGVDISRLTIYNVIGKSVAAFTNIGSDKINLEHLESGIYFLNIITKDHQVFVEKIIVN